MIEICLKKKLNNGVRFVIGENHTFPVASIAVIFEGGLRAENENKNGIFNFLSRILEQNFTEKISKKIPEINIKGFCRNDFWGICITTLSEKVKHILKLSKKELLNLDISRERFESVKAGIIKEIKRWENIGLNIGLKNFNELIYPKHPYGLPLKGTAETLNNILIADLMETFTSFAIPSNIVISIFGDINTSQVEKIIEEEYGDLPQKGEIDIKFHSISKINTHKEKILFSPTYESIIIMGFLTCNISDPHRYTYEVIDRLIEQRLFENLRTKALSYHFGTKLTTNKEIGSYRIIVTTSYDNTAKCISLIFNIIDGFFSKKEIERAKKKVFFVEDVWLQSNFQNAIIAGVKEILGDNKKRQEYVQKIAPLQVYKIIKNFAYERSVLVKVTDHRNKEVSIVT